MSCVFCSIVAGDGAAIVVDEDEDTMAFLALHPAVTGHTLVVPRTHATDIFDISPDSLTAVTRSVQRVANLLDDRLEPDGMNIVQNNRQVGWQSVFHLHVHVIPRFRNDGLVPPWIEAASSHDELAVVGEQLGARQQ